MCASLLHSKKKLWGFLMWIKHDSGLAETNMTCAWYCASTDLMQARQLRVC